MASAFEQRIDKPDGDRGSLKVFARMVNYVISSPTPNSKPGAE